MSRTPITLLRFLFSFTLLLSLALNCQAEDPKELIKKAKRIVVLGDSITYSGQYPAVLELWLATVRPEDRPWVVNVGLPSETVSGLSEEGHAGGAFPRPDVAERLERVLKTTKPDLVLACYGMNCGIYAPLDESRFEKYRSGIENLRKKVSEAGANIIHITPPFYDDKRAPIKFSYNGVLDRYSEWLIDQRKNGWAVIDLHRPMTEYVLMKRREDAEFHLQPDGVHTNVAGNWFIAKSLLEGLGEARATKWESSEEMLKELKKSPEDLEAYLKRASVLRDSYLSAAGHKRPGIQAGLSIEAAEKAAKELLH